MQSLWKNLIESLSRFIVQKMNQNEQEAFIEESNQVAAKTRLLHPEEDIRRQLNITNSLDGVWKFLIRRVTTGSQPVFVLFSVVDHQSELIRLRYAWPEENTALSIQGEFIPLCDKENHLVRTALRSDTTFTANIQELGTELTRLIEFLPHVGHVFSIPLVAAGKTVAIVTLGFNELDNFTQAKLSSVYILRDSLAQVVYNLILQEQLESQPPLDTLTQLPTITRFSTLLSKEIRKTQFENTGLCLMLIDFHQLKHYNQQYSAQMGDQALLRLTNIIKRNISGIDTLFRYRADQFAIILPERNGEQARFIGQSIITQLEEPYRAMPPFKVAIAVAHSPQDGKTAESLTQTTESTLHFAKYQVNESQSSCVLLPSALIHANEFERLKALNNKLKKQTDSIEGSDLFEALMHRLWPKAGISPIPASEISHLVESLASHLQACYVKAPYLKEQSLAVTTYAAALATAMNLPPSEVEKIRLAALLKNVGYLGLAESVLNKTDSLSDDEKQMIKDHPQYATENILRPYPSLKEILPLIELYHENFNGNGYPHGLKGENIPLGSRIIGLCDTFCALTAIRPHRSAFSVSEALRLLQNQMQGAWDPELLSRFTQMVQLAQQQSTQVDTSAFDDVPDTQISSDFRALFVPTEIQTEKQNVGIA